MTAAPFSNLQPGFQRKTPISLPTRILSVDGIFQIEYSHSAAVSLGRAHRAWRPEREGSGAYFTVPTLRNLFLAYLPDLKLQNGISKEVFQSVLIKLLWESIACKFVPQANQSYYTDRLNQSH